MGGEGGCEGREVEELRFDWVEGPKGSKAGAKRTVILGRVTLVFDEVRIIVTFAQSIWRGIRVV